MLTEVAKRDLGGQHILDEPGRRRGQQDLTSVTNRANPGGAMDLVSDEAGHRLLDLARMDAHANLRLLSRGPHVSYDRALDLNCGRRAGAR